MPHPRGVTASEIVVHSDELDVLPRKRVQVERQGRNEGLAFARLHFGNVAAVKDDAADELDVERDHVPGKLVAADVGCRAAEMAAGVLHEGERLGKDVVQCLALSDAVLELLGHARIVLVREVLGLILTLYTIDLTNDRPESLELSIVLCSKQKLQNVHTTSYYTKNSGVVGEISAKEAKSGH